MPGLPLELQPERSQPATSVDRLLAIANPRVTKSIKWPRPLSGRVHLPCRRTFFQLDNYLAFQLPLRALRHRMHEARVSKGLRDGVSLAGGMCPYSCSSRGGFLLSAIPGVRTKMPRMNVSLLSAHRVYANYHETITKPLAVLEGRCGKSTVLDGSNRVCRGRCAYRRFGCR
jgi:hypothetical protein